MTDPKPPQPAETKVAIGALVLLMLQANYELLLFCVQSRNIGPAGLGAGSALFLLLTLSLGVGLSGRSPLAWRCAVGILGVLAVLYTAAVWPALQAAAPRRPDANLKGIATALDYEGPAPAFLEPSKAFWLASRALLLWAVPVMLLLGRLRERLRRV
jgi:hypothetical protein